MSAFPGDPTPREVASADRKAAMIRAAVDRLLTVEHPATGDRLNDVIRLSVGPVIEMVDELADPGDELNVTLALTAELLLRALVERDHPWSARKGYETAIAVLRDVAERTGSPAASWCADYLLADPDRLAPPPQ